MADARQRTNIVTVSGNIIQISGQIVQISGQIVQISGQAVITDSGSVTSVSGNILFITNLSGQTVSVNISGITVSISGATLVTTVSGNPVTVSGNIVEISGQVANISGQPVTVSGNIVLISGQAVITDSGSVTSVSGNIVLISGQAVVTDSGSVTSISGNIVQISGQYIIATGSGASTPNYYINAAQGNISGTITGDKLGTNDNIPSSVAIILSNVTSASFPSNQPAAEQQMQVVSTSVSDSVSGVGAQQVTITYLTSPTNITPFKKKTEIVTLSGTISVLTVGTDLFRIDDFVISRVGSTGVAGGNITLQNTSGTITFEKIKAGRTTGETAAHYIEKGFGTLITDLGFGCSTAGGTILFLIVSQADPVGNRVGIGRMTVELANNAIGRAFNTPKVTTNPDGKEVFVIMAVQGRSSNQTASGSFAFIDYPL